MLDVSATPPAETLCNAPGATEEETATTLATESRGRKASKRTQRTVDDVRQAAVAVMAAADKPPRPVAPTGLSVFGDRRIAADDADLRQHAASIAERSYVAMPVIKSSSPRRWQNVLTERHQGALADLVDHTRGTRRDDPPELSAEELSMVRWHSRTIPPWLAMAFRDMRFVPTRSGILFTSDPRPQFLLWFYGGADEFQHLVARHAARSVLYFASTCEWSVTNLAVMWSVHDAIERVKFGHAAIAARRDRQKWDGEAGGRKYETDDDRARFVRMRRARFVRLRNVAERSIQKVLRDSILALGEVLGTAQTPPNAILSMRR